MGGGLMGIIKLQINDILSDKQPLDFKYGSLNLYVYMMNQSGLGILDDYVDYFISELDKIDDNRIRDTDQFGNTLLHEICIHSGRGGHQFSYRLFEYFMLRGVNIGVKNNDGKVCFALLQHPYWDKENCILK